MKQKQSISFACAALVFVVFGLSTVSQAQAAILLDSWSDDDQWGIWPTQVKIRNAGRIYGYNKYFQIIPFPPIPDGKVITTVEVDWRAWCPSNWGFNSMEVIWVEVYVEIWDGDYGSGTKLWYNLDAGYNRRVWEGTATDTSGTAVYDPNPDVHCNDYDHLTVYVKVKAKFQDELPPFSIWTKSNNEYREIPYSADL